MPKAKADDLSAGPYPQASIVRRIEDRARAKGLVEGKQIAGLLDAAPNWWTRRRTGESHLTVAEVSLLAEKLEAPAGWPWLDGYHERALASGLAEAAKDATAGPVPASPSAQPARPRAKRGGRGHG